MVGRRAALGAGLVWSVGVAVPCSAITQSGPSEIRPKEGDALVKIGDGSFTPLTPADIPLNGDAVMAWAMDPADRTVRSGSRLNAVLLVRLDAAQMSSTTRSRAADGVVAYTAICTHAGCEIDEALTPEQLLYCTCHQSKFDPKDSAKVVDGPAPRALPALPLTLADGTLTIAGPFSARIGFESA